MRGKLALFGLTACFAVGCSTVEREQKADTNAEAVEEPACHDCEPFSAIWQEQERVECVYEKQGVWDYNNMICSVG